MRSIYEATDCHMAFAIRAGAAPVDATQANAPHIRKAYKTVNLGTLYGQEARASAGRLGIAIPEAEKLLADHAPYFQTFWRWSDCMVQGAFDNAMIKNTLRVAQQGAIP